MTHEELIKKGLHSTYGCDECFWKEMGEISDGIKELEQKLDNTTHLVKKTCLDGSWYYVHADDCFCDQCMNEVEEAIEGSST